MTRKLQLEHFPALPGHWPSNGEVRSVDNGNYWANDPYRPAQDAIQTCRACGGIIGKGDTAYRVCVDYVMSYFCTECVTRIDSMEDDDE